METHSRRDVYVSEYTFTHAPAVLFITQIIEMFISYTRSDLQCVDWNGNKTEKEITLAVLRYYDLPTWRRRQKILSRSWYRLTNDMILHSKSKGVPRQAEVALGVPGRLRPQIILAFGTTRVVGRQPYAPAAFTPWEFPGTHFQGFVGGNHGKNPQWHHRESIPGPSD